MIAVDTNILVHAHRKDSEWHEPAGECLRKIAESGEPWMIPWPCLHEFFGIVTSRRIFNHPSSAEQALETISAWMECPTLSVVGESVQHWKILKELVLKCKIAGSMIHDAKIAAICLDYQVDRLWTVDRDFSRFVELRTENPLVRR